MKKIIITDKAPAAIGPYSQAVRHGDTLYISGQIPFNAAGEPVGTTVAEQTEQVLSNIDAILGAAGLDFEHVVKCSVFLSDMGNFSAMNEVYAAKFTANPPARETVEVSRLPKDVLIEISCIAGFPEKKKINLAQPLPV